MRHVRMLGLCLVAALAVCAYAVSSASALPEWGKCEAKAGGKYKDRNCTEKAKKGASLKPVKFSGSNVGSGGVLVTSLHGCYEEEGKGAATLPNARVPRADCAPKGGGVKEFFLNPVKVECEHESNTGEAVGKNGIANVDVKFSGCKLFGSVPCSNGPEGEILVNTLKGSLGYINKREHKVGVLLEPVTKHGEFAKFDCGGLIETVVGVGNSKEGANYTSSGCSGLCPGATPSEEKNGGYDGIISPITPVNKMTNSYEQVYTINNTTDENIPSKLEGKHIELLEDYIYNPENPALSEMWSPAGEEITNVNTPAEEGEIKA